jgi:hypothetical protein
MASFVLNVTEHGKDFKLAWTITQQGKPWNPSSYLVDGSFLALAVKEVREHLRQIAAMEDWSETDFAKVRAWLADRGHSLFRRLMPPPDQNGSVSPIQERRRKLVGFAFLADRFAVGCARCPIGRLLLGPLGGRERGQKRRQQNDHQQAHENSPPEPEKP